jgi:Icc-related predicted phosphoesterase
VSERFEVQSSKSNLRSRDSIGASNLEPRTGFKTTHDPFRGAFDRTHLRLSVVCPSWFFIRVNSHPFAIEFYVIEKFSKGDNENMDDQGNIRVAAVGDIHYTKTSKGKLRDLFVNASSSADVLVLTGDVTDYGLPEEAAILAEDLRTHVRIPILAVLGNHDYESAKPAEVQAALESIGVTFLDGSGVEIEGVGFAGVCGFGGGFDRQMLSSWGEPLIKAFVQEAVDHSLRLGKALTNLATQKKVVVLHYSPIRGTVNGENPEIYPFLGSSHLEATIDHFGASVVFHGHAHNGEMKGKTSGNIPVFNVALPVLLRGGKEPFFLYKV